MNDSIILNNLCQKETNLEPLKMSENKIETDTNVSITDIKNQNKNENDNHIKTEKISGIYSITNLSNNKKYFGSSNDCQGRWRSHKSKLTRNIHDNIYLQRAWNKYGETVFRFDVVENVKTEILLETEQKFLNKIKKEKNKYYNLCLSAKRSQIGRKLPSHTDEWKKNMSIRMKGKNHPRYGKRNTEIANKLNSEKHKGISPPNRDMTVYTIKNRKTCEIFTGTRKDFIDILRLSCSRVSEMVKGIRNMRNWMLVSKA